jgi:hypothetical protein
MTKTKENKQSLEERVKELETSATKVGILFLILAALLLLCIIILYREVNILEHNEVRIVDTVYNMAEVISCHSNTLKTNDEVLTYFDNRLDKFENNIG